MIINYILGPEDVIDHAKFKREHDLVCPDDFIGFTSEMMRKANCIEYQGILIKGNRRPVQIYFKTREPHVSKNP